MPPAKKPAARKKRATPKQKFIRNLRHIPVGIRLANKRRIDLQPRGQRGDTAPVSKDELNDEIYIANADLFEVITENEVKNVVQKQTINQQTSHSALSVMRDEYGNPYEKGVVIESQDIAGGKSVGAITERGEIQRFRAPGSVDNPIPEVPSDIPADQVADWVARQNTEGPEAGLAGMQVSKEEVRVVKPTDY